MPSGEVSDPELVRSALLIPQAHLTMRQLTTTNAAVSRGAASFLSPRCGAALQTSRPIHPPSRRNKALVLCSLSALHGGDTFSVTTLQNNASLQAAAAATSQDNTPAALQAPCPAG
ncbi:hypothetical protein DR999_PMT05699 [Platysternon megacephalum]|uniref:Uncharacterized protein n=1 Tax=Platysternon megacephalum TaxID=55544 RepID=A0A4D9EPS8_9SAUR|nr:hypothetical protein DR999_PMT05699 [Platysternon megacephalum]